MDRALSWRAVGKLEEAKEYSINKENSMEILLKSETKHGQDLSKTPDAA